MKLEHIESKFAAMGARLKVRAIPSRWQQGDRQWLSPEDYAIDIQHDRHGEFFELRLPTHLAEAVDFSVLNAKPERQHLLLLARKLPDKPQTDRFLCGHDERHWFVAAAAVGQRTRQRGGRGREPARKAGRVRGFVRNQDPRAVDPARLSMD